MNNKVKILKQVLNNKLLYTVQAVQIYKQKEAVLIPSPYGTEYLVFESLDDAIFQIKKAGCEYEIIQNETKTTGCISTKYGAQNRIDYNEIAEVFIKNLGHDNLQIRNSAINSLSKLKDEIYDRLIEILETERNWLVQQSAIKCIEKIISNNKDAVSIFLPSLIKISETDNTMVRSAALKALEVICENKEE